MDKLDQILESLYDRVIEPCEAKEQILSSLKAEADTDDVQEFMNDVHKWADDTFGKERTALAPLHHLKKEVDEAIEAMKSHNQWITIEELADCFILILNSSSKYKLSFQELLDAAKEKMIKNKSRQWGKADKNGVVEHIEAEAEKEVSDADIKKWIDKQFLPTEFDDRFNESELYKSFVKDGMLVGAKAMRDGKIKPNNQ